MKTKKFLSLLLAILMCFSCFSIISLAETTNSEHITAVPEGYVGIYTKDDLFAVRENPSGKYILMNDIIFYDADYEKGGDFYNSGKGWEPIGTLATPFKGTFNGNGYSIVNLQINNPNETHQGLFGYIYTATVKQVTLVNANIIGGSYIGGIIGEAEYGSKISNCIFSGIVQGVNCVGGIAGQLTVWGNSYGYYSSITIEKCANTGTINGIKYVGGIVGYTQSHSSYNSGSTYVYVKNCFNAGYIYATNIAAGISCDTGYSKVQNCLSVEEVAAQDASPITNGGTTTFCYYLDETTADYTGTHGTPKSDDQLRKKGTFEQWDFDTVWTMEGREDYPYPELRNVSLVFPDELNHEHEYSSEITTPATHLTEGVMTYTCSCGDTYTEAIAKTTEHTYSTIVTEPTCTDRGFTLYFCACNDFYIADYVEANGHSHTTEITTPATHLTEGLMTFTCACGDTYTETIAKTTEHTYNAVVTAPTCTEKGYTTYTCECGDIYIADYVQENGHSYTSEITIPATHLAEGLMTYTCTCGYTYTEAIAKTTEHKYSFVVTAPTCTERGFTTYTCACGDSYIADYVDVIEHKDANGDKCCDYCDDFLGTEKDEKDCSHMCHSSGIWGIIWKILNLFYELFGVSHVCECGAAHY